MAQKITQYPAKTVFRNEDVYDVSTYDGVNPVGSDSSYQTEKVTWAQFLAALTGANIYTADGTVLANRTVSCAGRWVIWQECNMAINMASASSSLDLSPPITGVDDIFNCWDLGAQNVFKIDKDGQVTGIGKFGLGGSSLITPNVTLDVEGAVAYREITDSLGASVNNYNLGNTSRLILGNTAGASIDVTGIANGFNGRRLEIYNGGVDQIVFKHLSASSSASNRLMNGFGGNDDIVLFPNDTISYVYSSNISRWIRTGVTRTSLETKVTSIMVKTTPIALTGTTSETVIYTQIINPNGLIANDIIDISCRWKKNNLGGQSYGRLYLNTSPDLTGSPVILGQLFQNSRNFHFSRTISIETQTKLTVLTSGSINIATDVRTESSVTTDITGINLANTYYFVFSMQNDDASDTSTSQGVRINLSRKW